MDRLRPLAMWVWYRGDRFRGFQHQPEGPTVQDALLSALHAEGATGLFPAGRTDRGVHARMQVVSIRGPADRPLEALHTALAKRLPEGVGIVSLREAPRGFHAQFSAQEKEYRYRFTLSPSAPPGWEGAVFLAQRHPRLLGHQVELSRLPALLNAYEGTHDFIAFHEKSSARRPRTVTCAQCVERERGIHEVRIRGGGFARYQIRFMVGTALLTAAGAISEASFREALARGTELCGLRAPGEGLVLWEVRYPEAKEPFPAELRTAAPKLPSAPPFL